MRIVVSPYHLTTREAPAMAALQLASHVVTMLPTPSAGTSRRAVQGAVTAAPRYLDLIESWRWAAPLWDEGVIGSTHEGFDAAEDVRHAFDRIATDDRYAPLRPLMKPRVFEDDRDYLQAVASDVLRGGPDPAITVPVAAGLDRFAARHGLAVARATPTSVTQRVEARWSDRLGAVAIPLLVQCGAERILMLRDALAMELDLLREALERPGGTGHAAGQLARAARAYSAAFDARAPELTAVVDPDEPRAVVATVAITVVNLPPQAVLDSSVEAVRVIGMTRVAPRASSAEPSAGAGRGAQTLPALWDVDAAPIRSLVFRAIGHR